MRQIRIPCILLLPTVSSQWRHLFVTGDDQAMITIAFSQERLVHLGVPVYEGYFPFDENEYYNIREMP